MSGRRRHGNHLSAPVLPDLIFWRGKSGLLSVGSGSAGFLEAGGGVSKEPGAVKVFQGIYPGVKRKDAIVITIFYF